MLQILRFQELSVRPKLAQSMFADRKAQFVDRLGWEISTTPEGLEIDQYDDEDAIYLIAEGAQGQHAASTRLRPTLQRTMLRDIFQHMNGADQSDAATWESTRFCVAPGAGFGPASRVLLAGQALGLAQGLEAALGIYDLRMLRVYRKLGWVPEPISECDDPSGRIGLGAWTFSHKHLATLANRAGITTRVANYWVDRAGGYDPIF